MAFAKVNLMFFKLRLFKDLSSKILIVHISFLQSPTLNAETILLSKGNCFYLFIYCHSLSLTEATV